jgi:K(+)-stimulated pyrophosphate-energized sodium pump
MLPANMKMEFFGGMQDISSMRVFYATIVGLVVGAVICYRILQDWEQNQLWL